MKKISRSLLPALLLASTISTGLAAASPVLQLPPLGAMPQRMISANGGFRVEVQQEGGWREAGKLLFDRYVREQRLDLGSLVDGKGDLQVRITQQGGGAAHLDAVRVGASAPVEVDGGKNPVLLAKVAKKDADLLHATGRSFELRFPAGSGTTLAVAARVEAETISSTPFLLPRDNYCSQKTGRFASYPYTLKRGGKPGAPQQETLVKELLRSGSGHPTSHLYGYVGNDAKNLYVTLDFTGDNTVDGDKDYTKVFVGTETGTKEFKISEKETAWGKPRFTYTDKVPYEHKVYDFTIPLAEIGADTGLKEPLKLAFAAYGTCAPGDMSKTRPAIAYDNVNNRFLAIYWKSISSCQIQVTGQLLNADGTPSGEEIPIGNAANNLDGSISVAFDSLNGRFMAVWEDTSNAVSGLFINADGSLYGTPFPVASSAYGKARPSVAFDSVGGRFLVVWSEGRVSSSDIYGQLVNADGTLYGTTADVNFAISTADNVQTYPKAAFDTVNQRFLVVWQDLRSGSANDIYGQMVKADGTMFGANFAISDDASEQYTPSVAFSGTDRFLVAWRDQRNGFDDIYGQLVGADGTLAGYTASSTNFAVSAPSSSLSDPSVTPGPGGFLAVWFDEATTIFTGQAVQTDGTLSATPFSVTPPTGSIDSTHAVAYNSGCGNHLVAFSDFNGIPTDISLALVGTPCAPPALSVSTTGSGTVISSPAGITCGSGGSACTSPFDAGTSVTLTATPDAGWAFNGWSGDCSADGSVTLYSARSCTAAFAVQAYTITATAGTGGTISPSGDIPMAAGGSRTFTVIPDSGYAIADVLVDGISVGAVPSFAFTNLSSSRTIEASFAPANYLLNVTVAGSGSVTGTGIACGADCSESLPFGTEVSLTAIPAPGFTFAGWKGACSGTGTCSVTVTAAASVTAGFSATTPLAAGYSHSVFIKPDGTLWAWGQNANGQLGDGTSDQRLYPVQVGSDSDWRAVTAGSSFTLAIKMDGTLWGWGNNYNGQLGDGTGSSRTSPVRIGTDANWLSVAAGDNHAVAVKTDGTLWGWGRNDYGQVGDGSSSYRYAPVRIGTDTTWTAVAAGRQHSVAVKNDGTLWAWGYNGYGQLGNGTSNTAWSPVQAGSGTDWSIVAAGYAHTVALKKDGTLWGWGYNGYGELGDGTSSTRYSPVQIGTATDWSAIATAWTFTVGMKSGGTLWAWGNNGSGQLGDGTTSTRYAPVQVGSAADWKLAAAGDSHVLALKNDGSIWSWGANYYGQLGDGTTSGAGAPIIRAQNIAAGPSPGKFGNIKSGTSSTITFSVRNRGSFDLAVGSVAVSGDSAFSIASDTCSSRALEPAGECTVEVQFLPAATGAYSGALTIASDDPDTPLLSIPLTGNGTDHVLTVAKTGMGKVSGSGIACGIDCSEGINSGSTVTLQAVPAPGFLFAGWSGGTCSGTGTCSAVISADTAVTATFTAPQLGTAMASAGSGHTVVLKTDGTIWSWGSNGGGQLGDATYVQRNFPVRTGSGTDWSAVEAGRDYTMAIRNDGTLWAWGDNGYGQLGDGTTSSRTAPVQVGGDADWAAVSAGDNFTLALKKNGSLWSWGRNYEGQLGDGSQQQRYAPVRVGVDSDWSAISAGGSHVLAVKNDGSLWGWGGNSSSQLGDGTSVNSFEPKRIGADADWITVEAGTSHSLALKSDGSLWGWGYNGYGQLGNASTTSSTTPVRIGTATDWSAIAAGYYHSLALKNDGTLWAWGNNGYGMLGDGTTTQSTSPLQVGSEAVWGAVAAGTNHSVALKNDGSIWIWGYNGYGQLGDGTTAQRTAPALVAQKIGAAPAAKNFGNVKTGTQANHTFLVSNTGSFDLAVGTVSLSGTNVSEFAVQNDQCSGKTLAAGTSCSLGILFSPAGTGAKSATLTIPSDDPTAPTVTVTLSGNGTDYLLTTTNIGMGSISGEGIACGFDCSEGVNSGAAVTLSAQAAPGFTFSGWSGGGCSGTAPCSITIAGDAAVTATFTAPAVPMTAAIAAGDYHSIAVATDGTLRTWGYNNHGQLGDDTMTANGIPTPVGTGSGWRSAAGGMYHTMAIRGDGTLWGWGYNNYGQLGIGSTSYDFSSPVQTGSDADWAAVATGTSHTVALKTDGSLWSWGDNGNGQLGDGTTAYRNTPVRVGADTDWASVAAGDYYTLAVKSDGTLWGWGSNTYNQLGDGTTTGRQSPARIGADSDWAAVSAGAWHAVAIRKNGTLWGWGYNSYGQVGDGTATNRSTPVQIGADTGWRTVAAGFAHNVAIKSDGTLWGWGYNSYGQVGDGTTTNVTAPMQIGTGTGWGAVAAGESHTLAVTNDGSLHAWGRNNYLQLGDGSSTQRTAPALIAQKLSAAPSARAYGNVRAGTTTPASFTISNSGSFDLSISATTIAGTDAADFSIAGDACSGTVLSPRESCPLTVAFSPATTGTKTAAVTIASNDPTVPLASLALGGTATSFALSVTKTGNGTVTGNGIACGFDCSEGFDSGTVTLSASPAPGFTFGGWSGGGCSGTAACTVDMTADAAVTAVFTPPAYPAATVLAAGGDQSFTVRTDGSLWGWGDNGYGQLGDGTTTGRRTPVRSGAASNWSAVVTGNGHTVGLMRDGTLWSWGYNYYGQLGTGDTANLSSATQVGTQADWAAVAAGDTHTAAVKTDGTLWTWGNNGYGQLGNGTVTSRSVPAMVGTDADWSAVAAGDSHTLALKKDGSLWAWGYNDYGQLGDGTGTQHLTPVRIGTAADWVQVAAAGIQSFAIKSDGTLWGWGYNYYGQLGDGTTSYRYAPVQVGTDTDWRAVSAGSYHTVAVKNGGTLWSWGYNYYGQLGDGTTVSRSAPGQVGTDVDWAAAAAAGASGNHTVALKSDGRVFTWGYNYYGQLGDGTGAQSASPLAVAPNIALSPLSRSFGNVGVGSSSAPFAFKVTNTGSFTLAAGAPSLSGANASEFSIQSDGCSGKALASGEACVISALFGPLSTGEKSAVFTLSSSDPDASVVSASLSGTATDFSLTVSSSGSGLVTGPGISCGKDCIEGVNTGTAVTLTATPGIGFTFDGWGGACTGTAPCTATIAANTTVTASFSAPYPMPQKAVAGGFHNLLLHSDGSLWSWGANWDGQLGTGGTDSSLVQRQVGSDSDWADIAAGYGHSVAVRKDGSLWGWGYNGDGQLGDGTQKDSVTPLRIGSDTDWRNVWATDYSTFAIRNDGTLWAWGYNYHGELGDGSTSTRYQPVRIGTDSDWSTVAAGTYHALALKEDGSLWSWGTNWDGQLGDGTTAQRLAPVRIGTDADWVAIAAGEDHSLALKSNGTLWSWGNNYNGQLGDGSYTGWLSPAQVGTDADWAAIGAGSSHNLAVRQNGTLWSWGGNWSGQLANGTYTGSATPAQVGTDAGWRAVEGGYEHSLAVKADGTVWAWGYNGDGELADGTYLDAVTPRRIVAAVKGSPATAAFGGVKIGTTAVRTILISNTGSGILSLGGATITGTDLTQFAILNDTCSGKSLGAGGFCSLQALFSPQAAGTFGASVAVPSSDPLQPLLSLPLNGKGATFALTVNGSGGGRGMISAEGIACGTDCSDAFEGGTSVTLSATPALGSTFTGWSGGGCSGTGSCTLGIVADTAVTATFSSPFAQEPTLVAERTGTNTLAIRPDGTLWGWGGNETGQIGSGSTTVQPSPLQIGTTAGWKTLAMGYLIHGDCGTHTLAVHADGTLWGWGDNACGQLGDGTLEAKATPSRIGTGSDWVSVAAGEGFSLGIRSDGSLWGWGANDSGQLGDGSYNGRSVPGRIGGDTDWASVAAGSFHTVAVKSDHTLWGWGDNRYGALGDGTNLEQPFPVRIGTDAAWSAVAAAGFHSVALKTDGSLWGWGDNDAGQLGTGSTASVNQPARVGTDSDWVAVVAGYYHTAALKSDGTLWTWGANWAGGLGDGTVAGRYSPVQVGSSTGWAAIGAGNDFTVAMKTDGSVWSWGNNSVGQLGIGVAGNKSAPYRVGSATDWRTVTAGTVHAFGIRNDGTLWAWGANDIGQLGDGTLISRPTPVQIGTDTDWATVAATHSHALALKSDGSLWGWGENDYGQVGDGSTTARNVPVRIGTDTGWSAVAAGGSHSLAIRSDGSLWAWGNNSQGYLGDGSSVSSTVPLRIGTATDWAAIAAGNVHSIAVKTDGTVWTWGYNSDGQIGDGTLYNFRYSPVQVTGGASAVAAGWWKVSALKTDGSRWGWGSDIGDGATGRRLVPTRGDSATDWARISSGWSHGMAIKSEGSLWSWGWNSYGQLGDGTLTDRLSPVQVGTDTNWLMSAGGAFFSVGLKTDGTLWSWGSNEYGQLGDGTGFRSTPGLAAFPGPIDTTAPVVAITSQPAALTNAAAADFGFSSPDADASFECSLDGAAFSACSSPASYAGLADGSHSFSVQATDPAGNVSAPAVAAWIVDTTAPDATFTGYPATLSNVSNPVFMFSSLDAGATFQCSLDGASYAPCTSPMSYTAMSDGNHTFGVIAVDAAGNIATPAAWSWTIDTTPPDAAITAGPANPTNQTDATFTFSSTDASATFVCDLDAAGFAPCTSPASYSGLAAGGHTFSVAAKDSAGNTSAATAGFPWSIDLTAPDVAIVSTPENPTGQTAAAFTFTSADASALFQCSLDAAPFGPCSSPAGYSGLAAGSHTFAVRAVDPSGNASPDSSFNWEIQAFSITVQPAANGSISTADIMPIPYGGSATYVITPATGYHIDDVVVDGTSVGAVSSYTFSSVTATHTIGAAFAVDTFAVTVQTPVNGSISTADTVPVPYGGSATYVITPATGYHIGGVIVDGTSVGAVSSYTFSNVTAAHTIAATFAIDTFSVTVQTPVNGTITTADTTPVPYGGIATYAIAPATGYHIVDVTVDGVSVGAISSYTFSNVTATHTIGATFAIDTFAVTVQTPVNGTITTADTTPVPYAGIATYAIAPATGYHIVDVTVDGVSVGAVASYTFSNVTSTHTIGAAFAIDTFTVSATNSGNGTVSPTLQTVNYNGIATVTLTPGTGYHIASATGCSGSLSGTIFTTGAVTTDCTVSATFAIDTFAVAVQTPMNGSISTADTVPVPYGGSATYAIAPATGYHIADVTVDGVSAGPITSYTFSNVTAAHTIAATFAIDTFAVTVQTPANGTISTTDAVPVVYGGSATYSIVPATGYRVTDVTVDGVSVGAVTSYTFSNVTAPHTIAATFGLDAYTVVLTGVVGGSGTGTVTPPTITASHGDDISFDIHPDAGCAVTSVTVNGVNLGPVNTVRIRNLSGQPTISVVIDRLPAPAASATAGGSYTVIVKAGKGGKVIPSSKGKIRAGGNRSYRIVPAAGWKIGELIIDGERQEPREEVRFDNVKENHRLAVTFTRIVRTVTTAADPEQGSITPDGGVFHGASKTFRIVPKDGFRILDVKVDGVSVGAKRQVTVKKVVSDDRRVEAIFEKE